MRIGLRFSLLLLFVLASTFLFATTYTFTGNGDWSNQANWARGIVPSHDNKAEDTILINGNATTTNVCDEFACTNDIDGNFGTIIIAKNASLTIRNATQFSSGGKIIVYGTLINKTTWEGYDTQSIIIYGTLINQYSMGNQGTITINEGGTLQNESGFDNDMDVKKGTVTLNVGGYIKNLAGNFNPGSIINPGGVISNAAVFKGAGKINGDFTTNASTLSPGNADGFGDLPTTTFDVTGDYTATGTAVHDFEVAGPTEGSYDALNVGGVVTLDGTLKVSLIKGFVPTTNHDIPIIKGIITGKFSTVNIPSRYTLIYNTNSVLLRSIPLQPVAFNSFTAQNLNNTVSLTWNVQNEQDALQYEIEHSTDGNTYTKIGSVTATNAGQYSFSDAQPQTVNYYRIKCLHSDGFYRYSSMVVFYLSTTVNTFNGEGSWSDASKWSAGTVPTSLFGGQRLVINGNCTYDLGLFDFNNYGEIVVSENSTLTLVHGTFYNNSTTIVQGTLINKADYSENNGMLQIFGTFINSAFFQNNSPLFTLEDGSIFINTESGIFNSGEITVNGSATYNNKGKISGNITFEGDLSNYSILAPGNSPGTVQVNGDYTAKPTAIHNFEVSGTANGAYDVLRATGAINLDGVLNVSLINGYTPGKADEIPIMQGAINGTFSKVNLPSNYTLVYTATAVLLKSVEALPVHFIAFDAKKTGSGTLLTWKVAGEINVQNYVVERRLDGGQFQSIGLVNAENKSAYTFTDAEPLQGTVYYRIKNVDKDGSFAYSTVLSVHNDAPILMLNAFPVPAYQFIVLRHNAAETGSFISLYTQDGKIVKRIKPAAGSIQTNLSLTGLATGLYIVQFDHGDNSVEIIKIVKQ